MPKHFPRVERQTGGLSDRQSAVITFTAPHCSAAPQTPGKLPQPLTFPSEKKKACYVNGSYTAACFVNWNHYVDFFFLQEHNRNPLNLSDVPGGGEPAVLHAWLDHLSSASSTLRQPLAPFPLRNLPTTQDASPSLMWIYDGVHERVCGGLPPVESCLA